MASILDRIRAGEADLETKRRILKGRFLPDDELLTAIPLMMGEDPEIQNDAQQALEEMDLPPQLAFFDDSERNAEELFLFLTRFKLEHDVLSVLVLNPTCSAEALFQVAPRFPESLLDLIVNNQVKILEKPEIVDALRQNPGLGVNQKQKLDDYERLLFKELVSESEELEGRDVREIEQEAIEEAKDWVKTFGIEKVTKKELGPKKDESSNSVIKQIAKMSVPQKVQAAIKGNREIRGALVRDANKLVCSAVIRSPRITEAEAEFYAAMRNVQADVLRLISMNREWTKNYKIVLTLVKNPRTPIGITHNLIKRVNPKDLRLLKMNRGIPEALRTVAKRLLLSKKR